MNKVKQVQIRNGFSDRNKIHPVSTGIQLKTLDVRTRNALANLIQNWLLNFYFQQYQISFFLDLIKEAYGEYVSENDEEAIANNPMECYKDYILIPLCKNNYDNVLSLVEFIACYLIKWKHQYCSQFNCDENRLNLPEYEKELNLVLEKEYVGYRFLNPYIVPISNSTELETIKEASRSKYEGCRSHFLKAIELFSNRENPDYKNSIKESISAVESICCIIADDNKATLGEALKKLEGKGFHIHPAMREAFSKLYGYTSNQGGIRHAEGMFVSEVSFEDAKYMLASCSAFVNFLIAEESKYEK